MEMLLNPAELARALDVAAVPTRLGPHDDARDATSRILAQTTDAGALFTAATWSLVSRTLTPSRHNETHAGQEGPAVVEFEGSCLRHVLPQLKACRQQLVRLSWAPEGLLLRLDPTEPPMLLKDQTGADTRQVADVDLMLSGLTGHGEASPAHDGPLRVQPTVLQRLTAALGRHQMDAGLLSGLTLSPNPGAHRAHVSWSCQEWAFGVILPAGMAGDLDIRDTLAGNAVRSARPHPQH